VGKERAPQGVQVTSLRLWPPAFDVHSKSYVLFLYYKQGGKEQLFKEMVAL
jgi:hypothetical protein